MGWCVRQGGRGLSTPVLASMPSRDLNFLPRRLVYTALLSQVSQGTIVKVGNAGPIVKRMPSDCLRIQKYFSIIDFYVFLQMEFYFVRN